VKKAMIGTAVLFLGISAWAVSAPPGLGFVAPQVTTRSSVYAPQIGEIIYDQSASMFYGRVDIGGTPAWTGFSGASSGAPSGSVIIFAGPNCPTGYLAADGKSYSQSIKPDLYAAIGTANGDGSTGGVGDSGCPAGSGCFNVPDYRGRFLRGVADGQATDPDRGSRPAMAAGGNQNDAVGSIQDDAIQNHSHYVNYTLPGYTPTGGSHGYNPPGTNAIDVNSTGTMLSGNISSETRVRNAYVNYCVKF